MTSRVFLELPAEIRNNIYRHALCYDGIIPEVRPSWTAWQSHTVCTTSWKTPLPMSRELGSNLATDWSSLRMRLDVMAPVRKGFYPGVVPSVLASDILNPLRACRQIYKEAHDIFWAENTFIFLDQETMHAFLHRIGTKNFNLIRSLGIERTINADCVYLANTIVDMGYTVADIRIPPFLEQLHLHGWESKVEEYSCSRDYWFLDNSDPAELKITKFLIRCKTTYNWLTWPSNSEVEPTKETSGATGDSLYSVCAM